jgi:hypothetical protein
LKKLSRGRWKIIPKVSQDHLRSFGFILRERQEYSQIQLHDADTPLTVLKFASVVAAKICISCVRVRAS